MIKLKSGTMYPIGKFTTRTMYYLCGKCKKNLSIGFRYCSWCGIKIKEIKKQPIKCKCGEVLNQRADLTNGICERCLMIRDEAK